MIEFYSQVIDEPVLLSMKEDLIELTTTNVISDDVYRVVITFYKIETRELNSRLIDKYKQFLTVKPENLGIDEHFCLNKASPILELH